jgi:branched-chain amino acid transport system permease protein
MSNKPSELYTLKTENFSLGMLDHRFHWMKTLSVLGLLIVFPFLAVVLHFDFYVSFASRVLIYALIATSLNLILGFAGMVSFGQAAFVGIGAYTVSVLMSYGITSAYLVWPTAMMIAAVLALGIGAISLRTNGVYFIMITLAFAQMLYYLVTSIKVYGGEDGMSLSQRSTFGLGLDLSSDISFYFVTLGLLSLILYTTMRLLNSRFGHALQSIRDNEERMSGIGFPVRYYKLCAFVISGGVSGLGGALLANLNGFVSPSLMQWTQSGMILIMVILGGVGHIFGGFLGAFAFLMLEEFLGEYSIHWQLGLGMAMLGVVLYFPNGLTSMHLKK